MFYLKAYFGPLNLVTPRTALDFCGYSCGLLGRAIIPVDNFTSFTQLLTGGRVTCSRHNTYVFPKLTTGGVIKKTAKAVILGAFVLG